MHFVFLVEAFGKMVSSLSCSCNRDFEVAPGKNERAVVVWQSSHQQFSARWSGHDGHLLLYRLAWLQENQPGGSRREAHSFSVSAPAKTHFISRALNWPKDLIICSKADNNCWNWMQGDFLWVLINITNSNSQAKKEQMKKHFWW